VEVSLREAALRPLEATMLATPVRKQQQWSASLMLLFKLNIKIQVE